MCVLIFLGGIHKMKYASGTSTFLSLLNGIDSENELVTPDYLEKITEKAVNGRSYPDLDSSSEPTHTTGSDLTLDSTSQSMHIDFKISTAILNDSKNCCDNVTGSQYPYIDITTNTNRTIYIGGLFELSGSRDVRRGYSELTAAKLAVSHINDKGILPGYKLELLYNDTKVGYVIHACML